MMEKRHCGLGITSFILSLACPLLFILMIFTIIPMVQYTPPNEFHETDHIFTIAALITIGLGLDEFIALILGLIGLASKDRKILFAILGTIFSALDLLGLMLFCFPAA